MAKSLSLYCSVTVDPINDKFMSKQLQQEKLFLFYLIILFPCWLLSIQNLYLTPLFYRQRPPNKYSRKDIKTEKIFHKDNSKSKMDA